MLKRCQRKALAPSVPVDARIPAALAGIPVLVAGEFDMRANVLNLCCVLDFEQDLILINGVTAIEASFADDDPVCGSNGCEKAAFEVLLSVASVCASIEECG
jgi:hypothetical protein